MKQLGGILEKMNAISISGARPGGLSGVCYDSREVRRHSAFVAIRGASHDGHDFIESAVRKGATTIVAERKPDVRLPGKVTLILVPDSRAALARLADYFYDSPSARLKVVGVTGTNGKTTVTYILRSILEAGGSAGGVIGTVGYDLLGHFAPAPMTTPESLDLQRMMNTMAGAGADYCLLEVSSHALAQRRVDNVRFRAAIFTNLTQDHLDFHADMDSYFRAKAALFTDHAPQMSIVNIDDPYASRLIPVIEGNVITYGIEHRADVAAEDVRIDVNGISMSLRTPSWSIPLRSRLTGVHNVYNILAASALAYTEGVAPEKVAEGVLRLTAVPGRFEKIEAGQPFAVVVDYAHTDDALANALAAARKLTKRNLITVFGCGGDRDRSKRALMGRTAWTRSDKIVVTSDNPRTEDPQRIIGDILKGVQRQENPGGEMKVIDDRREAIRAAIAMAEPGDFVMIAGKGHEDYQIVGTDRRHFDDREEARRAIKERHGDFQC